MTNWTKDRICNKCGRVLLGGVMSCRDCDEKNKQESERLSKVNSQRGGCMVLLAMFGSSFFLFSLVIVSMLAIADGVRAAPIQEPIDLHKRNWLEYREVKSQEYMTRADKNKDGKVSKEEAATSYGGNKYKRSRQVDDAWFFLHGDYDKDGYLTQEEVAKRFGENNPIGRLNSRKHAAPRIDLGSVENPKPLPEKPSIAELAAPTDFRFDDILKQHKELLSLLKEKNRTGLTRELFAKIGDFFYDTPEHFNQLEVHEQLAFTEAMQVRYNVALVFEIEPMIEKLAVLPDELDSIYAIRKIVDRYYFQVGNNHSNAARIPNPSNPGRAFEDYTSALTLGILLRNLEPLKLFAKDRSQKQIYEFWSTAFRCLGHQAPNEVLDVLFAKQRAAQLEIVKAAKARQRAMYSEREHKILAGNTELVKNPTAPTDEEVRLAYLRSMAVNFGKMTGPDTYEFSPPTVTVGNQKPPKWEIMVLEIKGSSVERKVNAGKTSFIVTYKTKIRAQMNHADANFRELDEARAKRGAARSREEQLLRGLHRLQMIEPREAIGDSVSHEFVLTEKGWFSPTIQKEFGDKASIMKTLGGK